MENIEFIIKVIDVNQPMAENPIRFSTIGVLLKGARKLSGRDLTNGEYVKNELNTQNFDEQTYHSNLLTGLINYLIFLEQLGSIFKIKNKSASKYTNPIYLALENFSTLSEKKINVIRALRNSLTHNYGLATKNTGNNKLMHKFIISIERNNEIVAFPLNEWNGDFSSKSDNSNTTIYIIDLIDLIEIVYLRLKEKLNSDNVDLKISFNELKARYTFILE